MFLLTAVLIAVAAGGGEAPAKAPDSTSAHGQTIIEHTPLERAARNLSVLITANITNPSHLFEPQVFVRKSGQSRFQGYTMAERKKKGEFTYRLPAAVLSEGSFEYFIEVRGDDGQLIRSGTPQQPYNAVAFDPPPVPVSTTITADVEGAEVRIDGDVIGKVPLTAVLAPGPHVVVVATADGRSSEQRPEVRSGTKRLNLNFTLPVTSGNEGTLEIITEPTPAHVFIDGTQVGDSPFSGPIATGPHVVAVEREGHLRQERRIEARQGRDVQIPFMLPILPKDPALSVESVPPGAQVFVDDKERGTTPFMSPLSAGGHQVLLKMEGHHSVASSFTMPQGRDMALQIELPEGAAGAQPRMTVSTQPPGAALSIDGKDVGISPWSDDVKPGEHKISAAAAGYAPESRKVQVVAGRDAEVAIPLSRTAGPGRIRIESDPSEATVSIDGAKVGVSPYQGELPPGEHTVDVARDGYRPVQQSVTVEQGQQVGLKLALQPAGTDLNPPLLVIASDPPGAILSIDGKNVGVTPIRVRTTPGPHEVRLALDGYLTRSGKANIPSTPNFELRMAVPLKPVRGAAVQEKAPEAIELARAQAKRAAACYRQGDWKCALAGYQAAYEFRPLPELLYNIAQTRRRSGDYAEAANAYRQFLKDAPASKARTEAGQFLAYCEQQLDPNRGKTSIALGGPNSGGDTGPRAASDFNTVAVTGDGRSIAAPAATPGAPTVAGEAAPPVSGQGPGAVAAQEAPGSLGTVPVQGPAVSPIAAAAESVPGVQSTPEGQGAAAGQVAAEASKPAAVAIAKPAATAPLDIPTIVEDTDPPVLTHAPVTHWVRGEPLKLAARIVDERSDVGSTQACWKNLFKTEYTCVPLVKSGEDAFGIAIPASAVTEGFAYYLEAYDTSENGPARSGSPELPNTVIIDEPNQPKVAAAAAPDAEARPPAPDAALGLNTNVSNKPGATVPEEQNHYLRYIAIGGAAATLGAGLGLELHANSLINSVQDPNHPVSDPPGTLRDARNEQVVGYTLFGVAAAFIAGAVLFWNTSL